MVVSMYEVTLTKEGVGNYRVIYDFNEDENKITVYVIKHRREVYKTRSSI
jgi:mRNA-degrading endonuclease RelE of RelBE toxin-antitoxin system